MIEMIMVYMLIVQDYQTCKAKPLRCYYIFRNCPSVTHYDYLKTIPDLRREAANCYMTQQDQGFIESYKRRIK